MDDRETRALLEECLRLNGEMRMPSIGSSMWPDIRSGDELRLARISFEQIAPGDIVLFHNDTTLVAHRVLKAYEESGRAMLLVKGDNRTFADPPIFYEQVVGRVEEAWRSGRVVYRRAHNWRDRWVARRSHLQEWIWEIVLTCLVGKKAIPLETQAIYQLAAFNLDWLESPILPSTLDWEKLYGLAVEGRLTPLFAHKSPQGAPDWFRERCRRDLRENQGHHILLYQQLSKIMDAFAAAEVPLIVLKGPAHADLVYPNPSWRPMVDIDLLVKPADWAASIEILEQLGFASEASDWSDLTEELTGQIALLKPMGPAVTAVELHRDLRMLSERMAVRGEVNLERAWAEARSYVVAGARALTLSPEDTVVYASTHWAQHHFFSSIWLLDIALMASRHDIRWDKLVRQAHLDGTAHFLWCALFLGQSLFMAPVPPEVLTALQPPFPKGPAIRQLVWAKALTSFHEQADSRSLLLQVLLFKHWRWTLAALGQGILPSSTWLAQHYGRSGGGTLGLLFRHWRNLGQLLKGRVQ